MNHSDPPKTLVEALGLGRAPELVSIVGGGGKSSLMFVLASLLPGRVVMTTTTRIFATQMGEAAACCTLADDDWQGQLDRFESSLLVVGEVAGDRAVGVPPDLPAQMLARPGIDWVVVEADGSRMRPVKAPAEHEPVVPSGTGLLVVVAGIDALTGPIGEVAHRPERVSALTGIAAAERLSPEALALLLTSREGGLKNAPPAARVVLLINKVATPFEHELARRVAHAALREPRVERVVVGALRGSSEWAVFSG